METDWAVGEVLAVLDQAGVGSNTLVVLTSDNGCSKAAGIPSWQSEYTTQCSIWRLQSGHLRRLPDSIHWSLADRVKAGSRTAQTVCLTDLMATCAEIVGADLPDNAGEDSVSTARCSCTVTRSTMAADSIHQRFLRYPAGEHEARTRCGLRRRKCRQARAPEAKGLPDTQLYDLNADLAESKNLQASVLRKWHASLSYWSKSSPTAEHSLRRAKRTTPRFKSERKRGKPQGNNSTLERAVHSSRRASAHSLRRAKKRSGDRAVAFARLAAD